MEKFQLVRSELDRRGFSRLESIIDVDSYILPLWQEIHAVGKVVAGKLGIPFEEFQDPNRSSELFLRAAKIDRKFISIIYDQSKQLPAFLRLAGGKFFREIYSKIVSTNCVGVGENSYGVRYDLPAEEDFRSHYHQEYAYNPQSPDGLVFWVPLLDILPGMGGVEILEGSHKEGHIRHCELEKYSFKRGLYKIGIPDEELYVGRYRKVQPLSKVGDILVMRFDTIHQSGMNLSEKLRVTFQVRYFNFLNPEGILSSWPCSPTDFHGYHVLGKK